MEFFFALCKMIGCYKLKIRMAEETFKPYKISDGGDII